VHCYDTGCEQARETAVLVCSVAICTADTGREQARKTAVLVCSVAICIADTGREQARETAVLCLPLTISVSLTSTVTWFQSNSDRESAFRDYRADSANEDNAARHLDSIGKWNIRYTLLYQNSRLIVMQVERLKDAADLAPFFDLH
jgi:hypothetical protein